MKKIIAILIILMLFVGCENVNQMNYQQIIDNTLKNSNKLSNQYRSGYKYYLPSGIKVDNQTDFNEKLSSDKTNYYLFIDFVGYYNKKQVEHIVNEKVYYSSSINYKNKSGYLEIKENKSNFYIEMMYNYAKIEVVSNKENLNKVIYRSIVLLSSIKYNDKTIENLIGEDVLNFKEEQYNIFRPKENTTNFIDYKEYNIYDGKQDEVPDYDLIK